MTDDQFNTLDGKLDILLAFIQNFTGPRIRPGDGSTPPTPPPAPPAPPNSIFTNNPMLAGYASSGGSAPATTIGTAPAQQTDPRSLRDLSDAQGPAIVEGGAGTVAVIACRQPPGKTVEITCGATSSSYGHCTSADMFVGDIRNEGGRGSDANGTLRFVSSGNDSIRVVLNDGGALEVHRSY